MTGNHRIAAGVAIGAAGAIALLIVVGLIIVYTGSYNVAATDRHADVVRWTFDTTMHRSVKGRAENVGDPDVVTAEQIAAGGMTYASTCVHCHGAPGAERAHWAANMRPMPPHLAEHAARWERREIFWTVKSGLKMTGMPAFGPEHNDETLWGIAAFVEQLPGMTPEDYAAITKLSGGAAQAGH